MPMISPRRSEGLARIAFVLAAAWSIAVGSFRLLSPITVYEMRASATADEAHYAQEASRQVSWYSVQGTWGVIVLLIFVLLYGSVALFAVRSQRIGLVVTSLLTLALTFLAGFSVGPMYFPAALGLLLGWAALGFSIVLRRRGQTSG
jgi:hypothetical protein